MTVEEIKANTSMTDVLNMYGIKANRGMCRCPFHGNDKHPSMQVFQDGCKCYACNQSFDIFSFIQKMDNCDFKTAFVSLGGTYRHESKRARIIAQSKRDAEKQARQSAKMVKKELFHAFHIALMICDLVDQVYPPMSDEWCEIKNAEPVIKGMYEDIYFNNGNEVKDLDAYRECQKLRQRFLPGA